MWGTLTDHWVHFPSDEQRLSQRSETSDTCPAWPWTSPHGHSVVLPQICTRLQTEPPALDSYLGGVCYQDRQPSLHVAHSSRHQPWETWSQTFFRKTSQRDFCEQWGTFVEANGCWVSNNSHSTTSLGTLFFLHFHSFWWKCPWNLIEFEWNFTLFEFPILFIINP